MDSTPTPSFINYLLSPSSSKTFRSKNFDSPMPCTALPFFHHTPAWDLREAIPSCKKSLVPPCSTYYDNFWVAGADDSKIFISTPLPLGLLKARSMEGKLVQLGAAQATHFIDPSDSQTSDRQPLLLGTWVMLCFIFPSAGLWRSGCVALGACTQPTAAMVPLGTGTGSPRAAGSRTGSIASFFSPLPRGVRWIPAMEARSVPGAGDRESAPDASSSSMSPDSAGSSTDSGASTWSPTTTTDSESDSSESSSSSSTSESRAEPEADNNNLEENAGGEAVPPGPLQPNLFLNGATLNITSMASMDKVCHRAKRAKVATLLLQFGFVFLQETRLLTHDS